MADGLPIAALPTTPTQHAPVSPELRRAAEEFESMAIAQLLQPIFAALDTGGLGGGGFGEEIFRPMLVDEYAKGIARSGGVGLARDLIEELQRMQTSLTPAQAAQLQTENADGADRR